MTRELRFNFGKCVLRDKIIDGVENHGHMLRHLGKGCEPRIIGQGVTADRAQQPLRGFRASCGNGQPYPIGCAEHTPGAKSIGWRSPLRRGEWSAPVRAGTG